jgi:hypothetical protein
MKRIILLLVVVVFGVGAAMGQVRPDYFPLQANPDSSNFEVYSQKNGNPRRANLWNLKKYFVPNVRLTPIAYTPASSGNAANLTEFVITAGDSIFYIDAGGEAFLLNGGGAAQTLSFSGDTLYLSEGGAVYLGDYLQQLSYSGDTLYLTGGGFVVLPTDPAQSLSLSGDTLYLSGDGSVYLGGYSDPAQTLAWNSGTGGLSISGGNSVTIDGRYIRDTGGAAGFLTYWLTDTTLSNANISYTATILNASGLTGAFTLPSGTDAQDPVWVAGMLRYNTTTAGFQGYNTTERYLPWADADNWAATLIPYSDGAKLVTSANWGFDGTDLHLTSGSFEFETNDEGIYNSAGNVGIEFRTSAPYIYAELGGSGNERYFEFENSARIGKAFTATTPNLNTFGVQGVQFSGFAGSDTYLISERRTAAHSNHIRIMTGAGSDASNGGTVFIEPRGSITNGQYGGVSGIFDLRVHVDKDTVATIPWLAMQVSGRNKLRPTIQLYNLVATTTGIKEATMEGDTLKYRISNIGAISTTTDASGDVTVTHGMGTTPTNVQVTVTGTSGAAVPYIAIVLTDTIGATTFKVRFFDAAGAAVTTTAVTAMWFGKT